MLIISQLLFYFSAVFEASKMSTPVNDSASEERQNVAYVESTSWLAKIHPYFKNPAHVLVLKLDCLLLVWAFIAGLFKVFIYVFLQT